MKSRKALNRAVLEKLLSGCAVVVYNFFFGAY